MCVGGGGGGGRIRKKCISKSKFIKEEKERRRRRRRHFHKTADMSSLQIDETGSRIVLPHANSTCLFSSSFFLMTGFNCYSVQTGRRIVYFKTCTGVILLQLIDSRIQRLARQGRVQDLPRVGTST